MMAMRLIKPELDVPHRRGKVSKQPGYLAALHSLPCIVTGKYGVEAAHVSYAAPEWGHYGRGRGTKAHDRFALPLSSEQHATQHRMNEAGYWASVGIDPHRFAVVIHGLWTEYGDDFAPYAEAFIRSEFHRRQA